MSFCHTIVHAYVVVVSSMSTIYLYACIYRRARAVIIDMLRSGARAREREAPLVICKQSEVNTIVKARPSKIYLPAVVAAVVVVYI